MIQYTAILDGDSIVGVLVHNDDDAQVQELLEDISKANRKAEGDPIHVIGPATPDLIREVRGALDL